MKERSRILCAAGHRYQMGPRGSRESISAILLGYDINFAQNEFDLIELAREGGYDLILMNCLRLDGRYIRACTLLRMFDPVTPLLLITNSPGMTEDEAASAGAQGLCSTGAANFEHDISQRASDLINGKALIFETRQI